MEVGACVSKDCSTVAFLVDSNVTFSDELCNTASWPTCCTQMWVFGVMNLLWLAFVGNTCSSQCIVEKNVEKAAEFRVWDKIPEAEPFIFGDRSVCMNTFLTQSPVLTEH